jgi:ribonuclease J
MESSVSQPQSGPIAGPNPEVDTPLRIIPLGGLGEIGLNMMVIEYDGSIIVIDVGLMFPEDQMFGIDIVIPNFSYLLDRADRVLGVFLTHGHEDHIGAIPYLLKEISPPIYGAPLALGLIAEKLREHRLEGAARLNPLIPGVPVTLGPFTVEPIAITHSIVDSLAFGITTPAGRVIHTGDFKIDRTPVNGVPFNFRKFEEYGEAGTLALLSDSTNAERPGQTRSELDVGKAFDALFPKIDGRIILATFSSNIHRIQQVVQAAERSGRKVFVSGKSILSIIRIAMELGYLSIPQEIWFPLDELDDTPDREVVIVTTGSQGEPMSSLFRMATDDHKQIQIKDGDTVILSARVIPGNEEAISRVINHLFRRGARVLHERNSNVHVSGHASQEEQRWMIRTVRPRYFLPVHGELRQLFAHADLAREMGYPKDRILILEDGDVAELTDRSCRKTGTIPAGRVCIDGHGVGDVGQMVLKERQHLGSDGLIIVSIGFDRETGKVRLGPEFRSRGFTFIEASSEIWTEIQETIRHILPELEVIARSGPEGVEMKVQQILKKLIMKRLNRRPMIIPIVIQI